jgi:hypothetical protein
MALGAGGATANLANAAAVVAAVAGPSWDAAAPGAACVASSCTETVIWIATDVQEAKSGSPPIKTFGSGQAAVHLEVHMTRNGPWSVH